MHKNIIDKELVNALAAQGIDPNAILRTALKTADADWVYGGVVFPAGTYFRAWWHDRPYWGVVRDGALYIKDNRFTSPSAAAVFFAHRPVNGWDIWECRLPGAKRWVRIRDLRKHEDKRQAAALPEQQGDIF